MSGQAAVTVYSSSSYKFGVKTEAVAKDQSPEARLQRFKQKYADEGTRRTVEGVLLVSERNTPHVLLIQVSDAETEKRGMQRSTNSGTFHLPGGRLRPGEDEMECLKRKLVKQLAPAEPTLKPNWRVGECVAQFWRPNFDGQLYPYLPPHVTRPKEVKKLFVVPLPEKGFFEVAKHHALVAVPLFELFDNAAKFGPVLAGIPAALSRLRLTLMSGAGKPLAPQMSLGKLGRAVLGGEGATTGRGGNDEWVDEQAALELYGE
mmetsp:Transcript_6341/g.18223  ORF Transcript_6341/g.18223 Transcript_6341/m.18223 type:complete len:261 (-) Transcript_6341:574-1356(-)